MVRLSGSLDVGFFRYRTAGFRPDLASKKQDFYLPEERSSVSAIRLGSDLDPYAQRGAELAVFAELLQPGRYGSFAVQRPAFVVDVSCKSDT